MYLCSEVVDGVCTNWIQFSEYFTYDDVVIIGGAFIGLSAVAWGLGFIASFIINSSPSRY